MTCAVLAVVWGVAVPLLMHAPERSGAFPGRYRFIALCPKCAKHYQHNRVVLLAQVAWGGAQPGASDGGTGLLHLVGRAPQSSTRVTLPRRSNPRSKVATRSTPLLIMTAPCTASRAEIPGVDARRPRA